MECFIQGVVVMNKLSLQSSDIMLKANLIVNVRFDFAVQGGFYKILLVWVVPKSPL